MMMKIGFNFQKTMSTQQYNSVGGGFESGQPCSCIGHGLLKGWLGLDHFGVTSDQFGFPEFHIPIDCAFKEVMVIVIVAEGVNVEQMVAVSCVSGPRDRKIFILKSLGNNLMHLLDR